MSIFHTQMRIITTQEARKKKGVNKHGIFYEDPIFIDPFFEVIFIAEYSVDKIPSYEVGVSIFKTLNSYYRDQVNKLPKRLRHRPDTSQDSIVIGLEGAERSGRFDSNCKVVVSVSEGLLHDFYFIHYGREEGQIYAALELDQHEVFKAWEAAGFPLNWQKL